MKKSKKNTIPNKDSFSLFNSLTFFCEINNIQSDFEKNPETLKIKEIPKLTYFSIPEQLERENKKKAR